MSIGNNIKKLRELRNFTQSYVSESLNMSLSGYSKIERDETDVSFSRLNQIATTLDTNLGNILDFDENKIFNIEQHNHDKGTQNGYVGSQVIQNSLNEKLIETLIDEIQFLKKIISNYDKKNE